MLDRKNLIIVCGPTASGKTSLSIELAKYYQTVVLSADSRQFYREMNIGTAKPDAAELAQVKHYFINSLSVQDPYSVGDFERDAISLLDELYTKHNTVLMAGGSGLFINAVCQGLDQYPDIPELIKKAIANELETNGLQSLQEELRIADPTYYAKVDLNNPHRLMRALAVCRASGKPFSSFQNQTKPPRNFKPIKIAWDWDRETLYDRINKRVDLMIEAGQVEEARAFHEFKKLNAFQTVGYQELFTYFDGAISLDKAIDLIKQNTRRYAKRQLTWFRKDKSIQWFKPGDTKTIYQYLEAELNDQ